MSETIRGELVSFRVRGQDFWGTGTVRTLHDGGDVTIAGKVPGAKEGDTVELTGDFQEHPKYGRQFKVRTCEVVLPSDVSGVVGWLAAKLPQVSRRRAEALVTRYGVERLWSLLDASDEAALCVIDGITVERAREAIAAYREHKGERDRMVRFKQFGLTDGQIARVVREWGDDAERRITADPYSLIEFVPGFGWKRADHVALRMGLALDAPPRCAAAIMHGLREARTQGHCYWSQGKLVAVTTTKTLQIGDEAPVRAALEALIRNEKLVRIEARIYLPELAKAEGRLAKVFATRARSTSGRAA